MALPKVLGTETEYGITVRNQAEYNPVLASSTLINAYRGGRARIQWSFDEESPGRDARGGYTDDPLPIELETGLVNVVLANGARLYVDHAHPEYSTPECTGPLQAALYEKAGEMIMARAVASARAMMPPEERIFAHKNNSDGKGNSYGTHENYLLARSVPFGEVVRHFTGFLVTRQIFTGSGKVGSENGRPKADFQITQRADFFEEEVGLETTLKRPIINTRDEPHADPARYRRLHVIIGDANLSETQTFLKLGSAMLILSALEDGALPEPLVLDRPVAATWQISHDLDLNGVYELESGRTITALAAQWQYLEWATKYLHDSDQDEIFADVVAVWESVLTDLEADPLRLADRLDWVAKYRLLLGYRRARRPGLGRSEDASPRPPVPRRRPRSRSLPPSGGCRQDASALRRRRGGARRLRTARRHPGVLSRPVCVPLRVGARGRQLGLARLRHGRGVAEAGAYDGTPARFEGHGRNDPRPE